MKKILTLATAAFLVTGVAFAHDGDKKCEKGKACCKKEQTAKGRSCCKTDEKKDAKVAAKTTKPVKKA